MKLKWIFLLLIIVPVVIVLALIGKNYAVNTYRDWKYAPTINPKPKYFMTVKGNVDPRLIGKITLGIQGRYMTSNKVCDDTYNLLGHLIDRRFKTVMFYPTTDPKNSYYEIKVPLDYFSPGFCQWSIIDLEDYSGNPSWETFVSLTPCSDLFGCDPTGKISPGQIRLSGTAKFINTCQEVEANKYRCKPGKNLNLFNEDAMLPMCNNYTLIENYNVTNGAENVKHS